MIEIKSLVDDRVNEFSNLKLNIDSFKGRKIFIADGEAVVLRLIKNRKIKVNAIFAIEDFYKRYKDIVIENLGNVNCFIADKTIFNSIVGFRHHSGVLASAEIPDEQPIEKLILPAVFMNRVINADNVGSIVRNCSAFGINSIIIDNETTHPYSRKAVRVSLGTVFTMNLYRSHSYGDLKKIKLHKDCKIIGVENISKALDTNTYNFPKNFILVFGNEAAGISETIIEICDELIYIPMTSQIESINVAAASAVVLNQYNYQKNKKRI